MNQPTPEHSKSIERIRSSVFSDGIDKLFSKYAGTVIKGDADDPFAPPVGEEELTLEPSVELPVNDSMSVNTRPYATELLVGRSIADVENGLLMHGPRLMIIERKGDSYTKTIYRVDGSDVMKVVKDTAGPEATYENDTQHYEDLQKNLRKAESVQLMGAVERILALREFKGDPVGDGELMTLMDIIEHARPLGSTQDSF